MFTNSSIQASNPQCAEIAFLVTTVSIGILASMSYSINRNTNIGLTTTIEPFCGLKYFFTTFTGRNSGL